MKYDKKVKCCLVPALVGLCIFYFFPFLRVVWYSFLKSTFLKEFAGLKNYVNVLENEYFRLACRNTLQMLLICVPCYLVLSIVLSLLFWQGGRHSGIMRKFVIFPIVLPAIAVVAAFRVFFDTFDSVLPIYVMYLWKYCGFGVILISAAFKTIPQECYEAARMDGAGGFRLHWYVTLPFCRPALTFTGILSAVFCFRIFRESYMYYGTNYPPDYSYTLQYYMNNHFLKLNYQNLAAASILNTLFILILVLGVRKLSLLWEKRREVGA